MRTIVIAFFAVVLFLAGCGGGGDDGASTGLSRDIGLGSSDFIILDLTNGSFAPINTIDDLYSNSAYTDSKMVFRRVVVPANSVVGSADNAYGHESDENSYSVDNAEYFLAVFELTQGQWERIGGTTPWTDVLTYPLTGTTESYDDDPAFNLSADDLSAGLSSFTSGHDFSLRLPDDDEWELAARAGVNTDYPWGDGPVSAGVACDGFNVITIERYARLQDSLNDDSGALPVASLEANDWGFHDMIGNVWECTSDDNIRGGDWRTPIAQARLADKVAFDPAIAHPGVGFRLIIER